MSLQPILPDEVPFSEIELAYLDEEPSGLWPQNQDSNFGTHRKIFCDQLMLAAGQLDLLLNEKFVETSSIYLWAHEEELGLTVNPAGKSIAQRRAALLARRKRGPFTHALVDSVIEAFIESTYGAVPTFGTGGIVLGTGVPLFSGANGDPKHLYRVYYDIRNFAYTIWIINTVTPNLSDLTREIARITPAGIAFTIDNTHADILDYYQTIINDQPQLYLRFATGALGTDSSGNGLAGTVNGSPAHTATPVIDPAVDSGNTGAMVFDAVDDSISVADSVALHVNDQFSIEAWLKPTPGATTPFGILSKSNGSRGWGIYYWTTSRIYLTAIGGGGDIVYVDVTPDVPHHFVLTKFGNDIKIYIDGLPGNMTIVNPDVVLTDYVDPLIIGYDASTNTFFDGVQDEVAYYNYILNAEQVLNHYNTGQNIV